MCRWGCNSTNTTYMCKWCGTWFCKECLRGAYKGVQAEPLKCRICFQRKCQGTRVDYVERPPQLEADAKGGKSSSNRKASSATLSKNSKNKIQSGGNVKKQKQKR